MLTTGLLCSEKLAETAFDYGRNIGIAFQLVDDILDFEARDDQTSVRCHTA